MATFRVRVPKDDVGAPAAVVTVEAEKLEMKHDGVLILYTADNKLAAVFARGSWDYAIPDPPLDPYGSATQAAGNG